MTPVKGSMSIHLYSSLLNKENKIYLLPSRNMPAAKAKAFARNCKYCASTRAHTAANMNLTLLHAAPAWASFRMEFQDIPIILYGRQQGINANI